jgi:hypothetical protein
MRIGFADDCPTCGALLEPNEEFPWHFEDDDCRSIKPPMPEVRRNFVAVVQYFNEGYLNWLLKKRAR